MCGRYAVARDPAALAAEFDAVDRTEGAIGVDHNVAPTTTVPIVVQRSERALRPVRWGFLPKWAKSTEDGPPLINARAETVTTKPTYAEAAARRRCLVPATGWYEWQPRGSATSGKQPYLTRRCDGASLAMAAVFNPWWPPDAGPDTAPLVTAAVVTTAAVGPCAEVHHRMPLVLPEHAWSEWLDPQRADVSALLAEAPPVEDLTMYPVSPAVNSVRNNSADLLQRHTAAESSAAAAQPDLFGAPERVESP